MAEREGTPSLNYEYDSLGRLKTCKLAGKTLTEYEYDYLGRIAFLKTPAGVIRYEYQTGKGRVIRTLPIGIRTTWEYEPNGSLAAIVHEDATGQPLARYTYAYRSDGLISEINESIVDKGTVTWKYEYDKVQRLIGATNSTGKTWRFQYDEMGNRLSASGDDGAGAQCDFDWAGRLVKCDGQPCPHDASGNVTAVRLGGADRRFDFDNDNRLARVNEDQVNYRYDGDGLLIARSVRGKTTTFVPDPAAEIWSPIIATDSEGKSTYYIWEGRKPLMSIEDGKAIFFLEDQLGSVRCVADQSGKVEEWRDYSPFGIASSPSSDGTNLAPGFAGMFWDQAAGLLLTRSRAFSPELGRFLQIDPQHRIPDGSQKNMSMYTYCGDDPFNFTDRNGAEPDSFNRNEVWWSTFGRDFYNLGNERSDVVDDILKDAWHSTGGDIDKSDMLVRIWRNYPGDYLQAFPNATVPTAAEWQLAENYMFTRYLVKELGPVGVVGGLEGIYPWAIVHYFGENLQPGKWQRQTDSTIPWQFMGIWDGLHPGAAFPHGNSVQPTSVEKLPPIQATAGASFVASSVPMSSEESAEWKPRNSGKPTAYSPPSHLPSDPQDRTKKYKTSLFGSNWFPPGGPGGAAFSSNDGEPPEAGAAFGGRSESAGARTSPMSPSPVGGVYLGGAGKSLDGLGQLKGVAVDPATGNVVLLGDGDNQIKLPPLRLDDVVTIFRSVYLYGEGPSVTINPRPSDLNGPVMDVVHGTGTPNTYVGWVLFEADRIMKCYNIGEDNLTSRPFSSSVPGYDGVLNTIYRGGDPTSRRNPGSTWERFWIVPSGVHKFTASSRALTLLDVPLEVKTQKMVVRNAELEDDPSSGSSPGAQAFTDWFTRNYGDIAREQFLQPPPETGITEPVPIYTELERISLIMAIAEQLRGQGVPMPAWMRDYEVKKIPVPPTTPALIVEKSSQTDDGTIRMSIYGGVDLSPADNVVKQFDANSDLRDLAPTQQEESRVKIATANAVAPAALLAANEQPALTPFVVRQSDHQYKAATLPGADARAFMPCRLVEPDLTVPIEGIGSISLTRQFHSFFRSSDIWGNIWTLALPRLETVRIPVTRTGYKTQFKEVSELNFPFGEPSIRFSAIREVPVLMAELHVPDKPSDVLALAAANDPLVKDAVDEVIFKSGRRMYFDKTGTLVADQSMPLTTIYLRDANGLLRQIAGFNGQKIAATITLEYDVQGRLESAKGKNQQGESQITYKYAGDGTLQSVTSTEGRTLYAYEDGLVKKISWSARKQDDSFSEPRLLRTFDYTSRGQLGAETDASGRRILYRVDAGPGRFQISASLDDKTADTTVAIYDSSFRPLEKRDPDRTVTKWTYTDDGSVATTTTYPDGSFVKKTLPAKERSCITETSDQVKVQEDYDEIGRPVALKLNGCTLRAQQWNSAGLLKSVDYETFSLRPQYEDHGVLTSILRVQPGAGDRFNVWQETRFDPAGRVLGIGSSDGADSRIAYDRNGYPSQIAFQMDGRTYGVNIQRSAQDNRIERIETSWGTGRYRYDNAGNIANIVLGKGLEQATFDFDQGRLKTITQFDSGKVQMAYDNDPNSSGKLISIETPVIRVGYHYASNGMQVQCGAYYKLDYQFDEQGRLQSLSMNP